MSLQSKITGYWILIHLIFGAVSFCFLSENRLWLLLVELFIAFSLLVALRLANQFYKPLRMLKEGIELIKDSNFSTSFQFTRQPEVDNIIHIYNRMLYNLQQERIRIQEKHYFLEKIILSSPVGMITLDFDDKIALTNPYIEKMLELSQAVLIGKKLQEIDHLICQKLAVLETGQSEVITLPSRRKIRCTKSDFYDQGFPRQFFLLEELTEDLRLSEKQAYEKMIRILSHEVNNSIGAANSLLHSCLAYKEQLTPHDQEDFEMAIGVVLSRTEHLIAFMRSYVNVVRLADPKKQSSDIRQMLENGITLFKAELQSRNIQVIWQMDDSLEMNVPVDRSQMEQVFVNIIKNAIEAIGEEGTLTIRSGKQQRRLYVSIEDTGNGIPQDVKGNLFTPFFSTKENGQGIGLTLIQEILSRHEFEFSLESNPGKPTSFTIYFD
ncbi:GHKL domain-containing protein [Rhodocytophaga rosea]|uniref:histidine kinase n=1 Tax=Rhodocytophaga rosea TaxID=2704465 RepID=A0A6C0GNJ6_9BACT|nr:ATP-binding protein [Rhodocytophaga rosea]QHT69172.1 GHKL domain-containing protein [Rhodocytophaga rosea]